MVAPERGEFCHTGVVADSWVGAVAQLGSVLVNTTPWGTEHSRANGQPVGTWGHHWGHKPSCPHSVYRQLVSQWGSTRVRIHGKKGWPYRPLVPILGQSWLLGT